MFKRFLTVFSAALLFASAYGQERSYPATYTVDGTVMDEDYRSHTSIESTYPGNSVAYATNGTKMRLTRAKINKTSGSVLDADRRQTGYNSAIMADKGSVVYVEFCTVTSHAGQADGISAKDEGTRVIVTEGSITTSHVQSSAANSLDGASVVLNETEVYTYDNSSPAFYANNGGRMELDKVTAELGGQGSAILYSQADGDIKAENCRLISSKWTIASVDGGKVSLNANELFSRGFAGFLLYGTVTNTGNGMLELSKNSINVNEGPLFLVTNTTAQAYLTRNSIKHKGKDLMLVKFDDWGVKGQNGGHATLILEKQALKGNVTVDSISSLKVELRKGGKLSGCINGVENRCAKIDVVLKAGSQWSSKGDSFINTIVFEQPVAKGVKQLKGKHTIYYDANDPANAPLQGKEYKTGGGKLVPLK